MVTTLSLPWMIKIIRLKLVNKSKISSFDRFGSHNFQSGDLYKNDLVIENLETNYRNNTSTRLSRFHLRT